MKEKMSSAEAKKRGKSADSAKLTKMYTSISTSGPRTVPVHCCSPRGSNSAESSREGVAKGRGKSSHQGSKHCLLLLSSAVQQKSLKTRIPVPTKSRYCPTVLFIPWQHD